MAIIIPPSLLFQLPYYFFEYFFSFSMSYLYILESEMCGDKGISRRGVYYRLGTVTRMMRGATNLMAMKATIA